jgi:hypothetical protein
MIIVPHRPQRCDRRTAVRPHVSRILALPLLREGQASVVPARRHYMAGR